MDDRRDLDTDAKPGVKDRAREEAHRFSEKARDVARRKTSAAYDSLGRRLHEVEENLDDLASRQDGNPMARRAADALHRVTQKLDSTSADELVDSAKREIGKRPGLTFAACFALGFLAARLLKE